MFRTLIASTAVIITLGGMAAAETFEVQMLNKGAQGSMVFEPAFLRIAAGDTVKFLATNKGHNAETIPDMIPEGATAFKGKINEEIEVTLDTVGVYGVRCSPHYAMGMVMTIAVGDAEKTPDSYFEGRIPPNAKKRFQAQQEEF